MVNIRYMGAQSSRADYNLPAQQTNTYPLWSPSRSFSEPDGSGSIGDVLALVKDSTGAFHARWIRKADFGFLPPALSVQLKSKKGGVWMAPEGTSDVSDPLVQEIIEALRKHTNVLLYGPPATGKTHLINEVRKQFSTENVIFDTEEERRPFQSEKKALLDGWITFHQSYSYEDFLVGLRPSPGVENSGAAAGFSLVAHPGILLELSEWARKPGHESLLVIDEINRGNVSRIFGEFITLLEPDKRLAVDGTQTPSTIALRLPFADANDPILVQWSSGETAEVPNPFTMPAPLFTLATMNSVDKSVAPLDAALRRRFHVVALRPDFAKLKSPFAPATLTRGIALLKALNRRISGFLGTDFEFGHWFLADVANAQTESAAEAALVELWTNQIWPQLEEHFAGRIDQLLSVLATKSTAGPVGIVKPNREAELVGASAFVQLQPADALAVLAYLDEVTAAS
jgi:5-methylcytosine-specific restriction protein B